MPTAQTPLTSQSFEYTENPESPENQEGFETVRTAPIGPNGFGLEITGFDCAAAGPAALDTVRAWLFEHRVLVFRDQHLEDPARYEAFMRRIGTPIPHVLQDLTVPGHPAILKISDYVHPDGTPSGVLDGGTYWHSDMSYLPHTGIATSLYALRAAEQSGGTEFLDLRHGWQLAAREPDLLAALGCADPQDALDLPVAHRFGNRHSDRDPGAVDQHLTREQADTLTSVRHRLVERHPVTGVPSLFATSGTPRALGEADERSSAEALDRLESFLLSHLAGHTHRYRPGDLVVWDNMSTLHRGTGVRATSELDQCRLLHRINVHYTEEATP
ncbi:MAG: TauD/TfdA family dioxygenase [Catenulispora sp.]|nr:TauD/TfdA family dioxygenase [Catenulispora sp.]